jgi:PTS system ascorbate-specific IIB component
MRKGVDDELQVLTICGVGMGSSLILRMTAEEVFKQLGVLAHVVATDTSSARGMPADIIIGQELHTVEFQGKVPVVVTVANFLDKDEMRTKLVEGMEAAGWLTPSTS